MENPKMIIFDVDGLLLNTEFLWRKAWKDVAAKYGVPKFAEVFSKVVGISGSDVERVLNNELSDVENRMELLDIARSVGTEYLENDIELMPGVTELLDVLENKNIRKAVFTQAVIFQCGQTIHHGLIGKSKFAESQHKSSILFLFDMVAVILCKKSVFSPPPAGAFTAHCPPWHREYDAPHGAFHRTAPWAAPGHFFAAVAHAPPTASA